jgi:hypothetical protein
MPRLAKRGAQHLAAACADDPQQCIFAGPLRGQDGESACDDKHRDQECYRAEGEQVFLEIAEVAGGGCGLLHGGLFAGEGLGAGGSSGASRRRSVAAETPGAASTSISVNRPDRPVSRCAVAVGTTSTVGVSKLAICAPAGLSAPPKPVMPVTVRLCRPAGVTTLIGSPMR